MRRIGVHLNALRAFEAAGRLSSISRAAQELRVSHSTVSHHVKGLEQTIGVALFVRRDRSIALTEAGKALLPVLSSSFEAIANALDDLRPTAHRALIRVTATPSFATRWLVPHLRRFRAQNSAIDVQLRTSLALADFGREAIDVGIRAGAGHWSGFRSQLLMPIHMTPLCSPALVEGEQGLDAPQALKAFTLLHADVGEGKDIGWEWREWFQAVGVDDVDCSAGLSLHDPGLVLQGAVDRLGVAMGYIELAEQDIAAGRLIQPFASEVTHPWAYYIITSEKHPENPHVARFSDWLQAEAAK